MFFFKLVENDHRIQIQNVNSTESLKIKTWVEYSVKWENSTRKETVYWSLWRDRRTLNQTGLPGESLL